MDWPAYYPDFNLIKKLWDVMVHGVQRGGKQLSTVIELESPVVEAWDCIGHNTLQKLVSLMPNRCTRVIRRSDQKIPY